LMRVALEALLQEKGFTLYGSAADAPAVIASARRERPDVVLIDVDLPGGALGAAEQIGALPDAAVVMMAEGPTDADVLNAIRAGAVGCLPKDISLDGLARALNGVLAGELAVPRELLGAILSEIAGSRAKTVHGYLWEGASTLTLRELEVLRMLALGASTADIARELSISPVTARRHCGEICRKLNVPDRASAVMLLKRSRLRVNPDAGRSVAGRPEPSPPGEGAGKPIVAG
jgi:DNA-binding NarL/FixJ family response regulator